eukprot:4759325-Amphidinium_carterae.1
MSFRLKKGDNQHNKRTLDPSCFGWCNGTSEGCSSQNLTRHTAKGTLHPNFGETTVRKGPCVLGNGRGDSLDGDGQRPCDHRMRRAEGINFNKATTWIGIVVAGIRPISKLKLAEATNFESLDMT